MSRTPHILMVGSFVMDLIVSTAQFPRQGQTVFGQSFRTAPGGKGANQAVQAARLGAQVTAVGKVGADAFGEELRQSAADAGIDTAHIMTSHTHSSAIGNILLETGGARGAVNRIIVVPGANLDWTLDDVAFLKDTIDSYDMVMLQLEIPMEINCAVAAYAKAAGVPVMLNPAPYAPLPDDLLCCVTYLTPNEFEAADLSGMPIGRDENGIRLADARAAAQALMRKGVGRVIITMGDAGAYFCSPEECFVSPSVTGIQAVDPTAAGDSFVSSFCTARCMGMDEHQGLRYANHCAALTVCAMGAQPSLPTADQVEQLLQTSNQ